MTGATDPVPPPKPGYSCPRLCTPFVLLGDRCAVLIRRATDGGCDRRFHLLTSNVGGGRARQELGLGWPHGCDDRLGPWRGGEVQARTQLRTLMSWPPSFPPAQSM
jgi:hypothetical protein